MPQSIVSGVQHQLRRGTYSQAVIFTGAVGEVIFDTTYNRPLLQDGEAAGGFAASMASYQQVTGSTTINPNVANVLVANTGAVTLTLPLAALYMPGQVLKVVDIAAGAGTNNITVTTFSTTDKMYSTAGVASTSLVINVNGKSAQFFSNSSQKWVGAMLL